ncbi:hypothetical protein V1279_007563 [Bradyrhizobium sp. AZCC 1610]|uniref:hypothetical protein n=1 Tax=Bradyrhizobium sp. AZCC 1610 TaxID=3117020 RepID=UPI002FF04B2E
MRRISYDTNSRLRESLGTTRRSTSRSRMVQWMSPRWISATEVAGPATRYPLMPQRPEQRAVSPLNVVGDDDVTDFVAFFEDASSVETTHLNRAYHIDLSSTDLLPKSGYCAATKL